MRESALKNIINSQNHVRKQKISIFYLAAFLEAAAVILLAYSVATILSSVLETSPVDYINLGFLAVCLLLNIISGLLQSHVNLALGELSEKDLRSRIVEKLSSQKTALDSERFSILFTRAVSNIGDYYRHYLPARGKAIFIPSALLVTLLYVDLISGGILLVVTAATIVFMILTGDIAKKEKKKRWAELKSMRRHFIEIVAGGETMRQLGAASRVKDSLIISADKFRKVTLRVLRFVFISSLVLEFMATVSVAMVAVVLGLRLIDGSVSYRSALIVLIIIPEFFTYLRKLGAARHYLLDAENASPMIESSLIKGEVNVEPEEEFKQTEKKEKGVKKKQRIWIAIVIAAFFTLASHFSQMGLLVFGALLLSRSALQHPISTLHAVIAGVRFFGLARPLTRYAARLTTHNIALLFFKKIRLAIFDKISELDFQALRRFHSGEITRMMDSDTERLDDVGPKILWPLFAMIVIMLAVPFIPPFSQIAPRPVFILLLWLVILLPWLFFSWIPETPDFSDMERAAIDFAKGVKDYVSTDVGSAIAKSLTRRIEEYGGIIKIIRWRVSIIKCVSLSAMVVLWGFILLNFGQLDGIYLAVVIFGVISFTELFGSVPDIMENVKESLTAYDRILGLVSLKEERRFYSDGRAENADLLVIDELSWQWSENEEPLFDRLSLRLEKGKFYGWVGPVGSGKSTLLDIATGFYEIPESKVFLDGYDVARTRQQTLFDRVSYVSQRSFVFHGSMVDNMELANPNVSRAEIEEALNLVGLPGQRYDLEKDLGENAILLSGGERQRLILARAMVQKRDILLLDEPFNNLDHATQERILGWIENMAGKISVIMVSHQNRGIELMDDVLRIFES